MKALTISQPFASLIVSGEKRFENRTWDCRYRGPLAIHAGKGTQYLDREKLAAYPTSAIIGVCAARDCLHVPTIRDFIARGKGCYGFTVEGLIEMVKNPHFEGPYAIVLEDITPLETPIPMGGKQGLWNVPAEFVSRLNAALPIPF